MSEISKDIEKNRNPVKVALTYTGRRMSVKGRILHCFVDRKGNEYAFSKVRTCVIGWEYEAEKTTEGLTIERRPKALSTEDDRRDVREWEALDAAATQHQRNERVLKRARKNKQVLLEVDAMRAFTRGMSFSDKRAFLEFLLNELEYKTKSST
jgi:hypothetical protein